MTGEQEVFTPWFGDKALLVNFHLFNALLISKLMCALLSWRECATSKILFQDSAKVAKGNCVSKTFRDNL
jgi:hypothetical protein